VVDLLITDLGVFEIDRRDGLRLTALADGVSVDEIRAKTEASFTVADGLKSAASSA